MTFTPTPNAQRKSEPGFVRVDQLRKSATTRRWGMVLRLERTNAEDAAAIAALRLAAARDLTARFGEGTWSFALGGTDRNVCVTSMAA